MCTCSLHDVRMKQLKVASVHDPQIGPQVLSISVDIVMMMRMVAFQEWTLNRLWSPKIVAYTRVEVMIEVRELN